MVIDICLIFIVLLSPCPFLKRFLFLSMKLIISFPLRFGLALIAVSSYTLWSRSAHCDPVIYATADEADAYMFYICFFLFFSAFSVRQKYETTVLGNG